jgi:hypothetical protein
VCSLPGNKQRSTVSKHIVGTLRILEKNVGRDYPYLQNVSTCYEIIFHNSSKANSLSVFCASGATSRGIILYPVYWTGQPCDSFLPFVMRNLAPGFFLIAYWLFRPTFQPNSLLLANIKSRGSLFTKLLIKSAVPVTPYNSQLVISPVSGSQAASSCCYLI